MVCLGAIVLRILHPDMHRPFRTPFSPLFPVLGMLSCAILMAALPLITWLRFLTWLAIGLAIYFLYSIHESKLASDQSR